MDRLKRLEEEIKRHKSLYYRGTPEINDFEYDKLEEELRKIDPGNPVLSLVGTVVDDPAKVAHARKMKSLNKVYSLEELKKWAGDHDVVSMFKLDGSSCSLVYRDGKLVMAKTRGDGSFGENISLKVPWIDTVPTHIRSNGEVEVRGEIYCNEASFYKLSEEMVSIRLDKPTSQRNIVAGILGRKDNIDLARFLNFMAFDLIDDQGAFKTELKKFEQLGRLGFETPHVHLHKNPRTFENAIQEAQEFSNEGPYLIDGLVFSYNDLRLHDEMGETAHHPRYKMAFKFAGETKTTTIREIVWQVSRNGILTPVAEVEPVELSGAMISRLTLHNYGMVKQWSLKAGDQIEIVRSGEVIPKFLSLIKAAPGKNKIPDHCPSCGGRVEIEEIRLVCPNPACPAQLKETILHFIEKIGIEELSSKRLDEMIRAKAVKAIPDLYRLDIETLKTLDKTKDKLAQKLFDNIQRTKEVSLKTLLSSLGLSGGAYNKCEKVVDAGIDNIEKIKQLTEERLKEIEGFAEISAKEFATSLKSKLPLIDELLELGFKFKTEGSPIKGPLSGKRICITGALSEKRSVMEKKIRDSGGVIVDSVSKNTDILLTNETESSSSKFKKAKELGIQIVSEDKILRMFAK